MKGDTDGELFSQACAFRIQFGKFANRTLAEIGSTDDGLKYLDWLVGQGWLREPVKSQLKTYLMHPAIQRLVDGAIDN